MEKKIIVISGVNGFIGSGLNNYLKSVFEIIGVSREIIQPNISYENLKNFKNYNVFIHLAGLAHDLKNASNFEDYQVANVDLTKYVFDCFLKSEAQTFIFFSSVKALTDQVEGELKEDYIPNPKSLYGKSKLEAEKYLLNQVLPENKRLIILRPCMVYGPNNKGNLKLLYRLISKSIPFPLGKFENKRSFLSIDNLCFIVKEIILNQNIKTGDYNLADDQSLSTIQIVKIIGKSIDKKVYIINISKTIIYTIAKIGDFLNFPLNSEKVEKLTSNYVVSNKKIIEAIGKDLPVSSYIGIENIFKNLKK